MATSWPGLHGPGCRGGDVGVHVAHGDGDALGQAGPCGGFGREVARGVAQPADGVLQLGADEVLELRVQGGEEVLGGVAAVLVDALVAGGAGVADVVAAELPDDPVGGLHPVVHGGVGFRVLLEELQSLGEFPFGGDEPAIAREPAFAAFSRQGVDPVRLRLRGVVAPEFHIGVRPVGEPGQLVQRCAVRLDGHHGAGGEVGGNADDGGGVDSGVGDRRGDCVAEDVAVVVGHLQRPVPGKPGGAVVRYVRGIRRQRFRHHAMRVVKDAAAQFLAVADPDHHGPPGERAEVHANDKVFGSVH